MDEQTDKRTNRWSDNVTFRATHPRLKYYRSCYFIVYAWPTVYTVQQIGGTLTVCHHI